MEKILRIARKEFTAFFSSAVAFIFMGAFLAVNLFVFFWVETFFATNIAEVRALFKWMPILLIFLTSAITMRLWAEEKRAGTLEFLLTSPAKPLALVMGKFLGCLALVVISLILTLPLPVTVGFMGALDWGPVFGGYLAALFLSAAYIAIGLYISAKSENQIVSLITTALVCSLFYLLGSDTLTGFLGTKGAEFLQLLGSGSRFESITRGVIDFRDLYYYVSIMGVFLCLNVLGLEKIRWAGNPRKNRHLKWQTATWLLAANFIVANFWLAHIGTLRGDLTQGNIYSISEATKSYLRQLKEPLLIRGYFSAQTHPLLAPLVPRIQDLLEEYSIAGGKGVNVEFVDPLEHPEIEQEAGQKYGIRPVPFQTTSKYQAAVTNSYFDVLVQYGDQFEILGFRDLIEVKVKGSDDLEVELRNPEYDITRAIRKTLYSYQGGGDLFADIGKPIKLTGFLSPAQKLPETLVKLKEELQLVVVDLQKKGGELFSYTEVDPDGEDGRIAQQLQQEYGFRPMAASLFDQRTFWFYLILESGDQTIEIPLPQEFDRESLERSINAGLKRFATGFTKNVALHTQPITPPMAQYGIPPRGKQFNILRDFLRQDHRVTDSDLKTGMVPEDVDLLMLVSPENLDDKQLFAVDQFLMQGGTVVVATSPYDIETGRELTLVELDSGLQTWLSHHGIEISKELVLDSQNSPFPIPTQRNVGGFTIQETKMLDYPFFIDIRSDGMNSDSPILSGIPEITLNWSSPISINEEASKQRKITHLLESSPESWVTTDLNLQPDFETFPQHGFARGETTGSKLLGVALEGSFVSYYTGKPSPLLVDEAVGEKRVENKVNPANSEETEEKKQVISRVIDKSPASSRIICFASNTFLADSIISLGSGVRRTGYLEPVQMVANAVDWSLEESGLLEMRGRSHFSRPLHPMGRKGQLFFEYLNYGLAVLGLLVVWGCRFLFRKKMIHREHTLLQQISGRV